MGYYIQVTDVTRPRATGVTIAYDLRDDSRPGVVVDSGSIGLEFPDVSLAPAVRRQSMKDSLISVFRSIIDRATVGDSDYEAVRTAVNGIRYPAS